MLGSAQIELTGMDIVCFNSRVIQPPLKQEITMPIKTKKQAQQRAKELGIPESHIMKTDKGYFIAPKSLESSTTRRVYAENRAKGKSAEYSAKIANTIQKNRKKRK